MKLPEGCRVDWLEKGDALITYPGDTFATWRLRESDGAVRTAFLNEPCSDKEKEDDIRQLVAGAIR